MLQRSEEWFDIRLGKFTASEIHKLMGIQGLGKVGETYCFEKACELVYGKDDEENFISYDMQRGVTLEPMAFRKFVELKAMEFVEVKECTFFPYSKDSGASPDGVVGNDAILEIKCPRSTKFFNLVAIGESAIDKEYFHQMQFQMLCSNSIRAHFFNYIIFKGTEMWHEIEVNRCEKTIEIMKKRIEEAVILRNQFVEYLTKNQQF